MLLAIDSSIGSSAAVVDPATGVVLSQADGEGTRGHAEVIGSLIVRALDEAGIAAADITAVAAGMGPGPFTGLRIGIAAARAFAVGRGLDAIPVVSHDAAALEILEQSASATIVTDARRREHAVSVYTGLDADGIPVRASGPTLVPTSETLAMRPDAGDSAGSTSGSTNPPQLTTRISAGALGRLAARQVAAGRVPELSEPLYLRAPDAKVPGAVKRVST